MIKKQLYEAYDSIKDRLPFVPSIALVLGSGLGDFAESLEVVSTIDYSSIANFPVSTVVGHKGRFVFGKLDGINIVAMQGRVHYYEGYEMSQVVMPIRLMKLMGANILMLTNAAGGVNKTFSDGTLMAICDSVVALVPNPLRGDNIDELGARFPDMSEIYNRQLLGILRDTAQQVGVKLREGVYVQFAGPSYESPAEIRWISNIADAVGMSTACEAVAANHMGMKVCAISCITNMAAGLSAGKLSHAEVQATANRVKGDFTKLVRQTIINIDKQVKEV